MQMNISNETMKTVMASLYASRQTLKRQEKSADHLRLSIIQHQLDEVNEAIRIFEEYGF